MDIKDQKLLFYLSTDARMTDTQLSKKIGLSKNAIKYRISRLKNEGIIKHFASVVNLGALGLDTFTMLLKFNDDIYENKEILEHFKTHPFADWVTSLSGDWDIFAEFVYRDGNHMQEIIRELTSHFGILLNTYQVYSSAVPLRVEHLPTDFYRELQLGELPRKRRVKEKYKADKTDQKILYALTQDSSLPYLEIAQNTKLTMDIVRYRIKQLTEKGIIVKFFPEVSLPKLGYTEYLCNVQLKNVSAEKMEALKAQISANGNVTYAFFDLFSFSLVFDCAFRTADEIDHFFRSLRKQYGDIIEKQEYMLVKEQILFNLFPKGLVE